MRYIICLILLLGCGSTSASAQVFDPSMLGFKVEVYSQHAPDNVVQYVENALTNILSREGLAYSSGSCVMEVSINEVSKTLTYTAPAYTQLHLEIDVKAVDREKGVLLNSITFNATGMDSPESKAYLVAARNANFKTRNFLNFINVTKQKLFDCYAQEHNTTSEPQDSLRVDVVCDNNMK